MTSPQSGGGRKRKLGARRRRLRLAALWLTGLAVSAAIVGWAVYRATRPDVRRPGEDLPEITERLSRNLPAEAPTPKLVDVTEQAGLAAFETFRGVRTSQLPEDMGAGAAWGDFDDDGDDDLFLVSAGGPLTAAISERAPSQLFENLGDGTFRVYPDFPELRLIGMGAAWADYDGDADLDLAVSGYRALRLLRNDGGRFVFDQRFAEPDGYWAGLAWGDYDRDGDPDLYVCGYVRYQEDASDDRRTTQQYGASVPFTLNPSSYDPLPNLLFENRAGELIESAAELGVANPTGRSLGAVWHDFDQNGTLDLYVANDISDNVLFLNRGDRFEDASLAAWVADYRGAMGLAVADWNRDGDDDLFVTHWVAQENALYDSRLAELRARDGEGAPVNVSFSDRAAQLGLGQVALQSVGWGTEFVDLDGDSWLDLLVVNGSTIERRDDASQLEPQAPMVFWNQQGKFFHDVIGLDQELATPVVGRGLALSDYDRDGDVDVLIVRLGSGVQLLRNEMQTGGWLELDLRQPADGGWAPAFGATATVALGEVELRRTIGGGSYLSQSSPILHFGLGDAPAVTRIDILWPDGDTESREGVATNARWQIRQGDQTPTRLASPHPAASPGTGSAAAAAGNATPSAPADERERTVAFWAAQRAAMEAIKRDDDCDRAIPLFRRALELRSDHEDSRYYLANCLVRKQQIDEALEELNRLRQANPLSHRGNRQWGVVRALHARSRADLEAAEQALERSLEINREETGALQVLGEVSLLLGHDARAAERLEWVTRTNPKAVGAFFLRAFLARRHGDITASQRLLQEAREAGGDAWKPEGAVAEGDTKARQHSETTPLSRFWVSWNGQADPATAFAELEAFLERGPESE